MKLDTILQYMIGEIGDMVQTVGWFGHLRYLQKVTMLQPLLGSTAKNP